MIRCEVIKEFTLEEFDKLKNIKRKNLDTKGRLYVEDTFECDKAMADYLMGENKDGYVVVKVIEVEPEKDVTEIEFEIRSEEVKELVNEKIKETKEIIKPKKKKSSKK